MAAYNTTKVGTYYKLKPPCPKLFLSNVVYQFSCCRDDNTTYIGETRRQLFRRVEDHNGKDQQSAVFQHLYNCTDCQSSNLTDRFNILKTCGKGDLLSCEALMISKYRPKLNTQLGPAKGTQVSLSLYTQTFLMLLLYDYYFFYYIFFTNTSTYSFILSHCHFNILFYYFFPTNFTVQSTLSLPLQKPIY